MPIFKEIQTLAKSKESKQAFLDVACLLVLADNKSTLAEQDWIDNLLSMDKDGSQLLEEHFDTSMSQVKAAGFKPESMITRIAQNLNSKELKALGTKFVDEFVAANGSDSAKEKALAAKLKQALGQ